MRPDELGGAVALVGAIALLFIFPLLTVKHARSRGEYTWAAWIFWFTFFGIGGIFAMFYWFGTIMEAAGRKS